MILKDISYARLFNEKQVNAEILFQFKITIFNGNLFWNVIYSCDGNAKFSAAIPSDFTVTWCFRSHSIMLVCCWRNICLNYFQIPKRVVLHIFFGDHDKCLFRILWIEKGKHLFFLQKHAVLLHYGCPDFKSRLEDLSCPLFTFCQL